MIFPQHTADGASLGGGSWSLVPPGSDDFTVGGTLETVERARGWAFDQQVLLYQGPAASCVHGLYRMDMCAFPVCHSVGLDHTQIWVQHDARSAFLLTQPYVDEVPESLHTYARMHGLRVDSFDFDGWYGHGALPIRLTLPTGWPLWPIERDAALLLHVRPVEWPEDNE